MRFVSFSLSPCSTGMPVHLAVCRSLAFDDASVECGKSGCQEFSLLFDDPTGLKWLDWMWSCTAVIDALAIAVRVRDPLVCLRVCVCVGVCPEIGRVRGGLFE